VLTERRMPESILRSQMAKLGNAKMDHTITVGEREIVIPVTGSWEIFKLAPAVGAERVLEQLAEFSIHHAPKHDEK
jgi:hypothetical protein